MSKTLRMKSNVQYDSDDSDSDFDPVYEEETKGERNKPQGADDEDECPWRSAVDPNSGKTYYYHVKTRETQWRKPMEMASREEREALAAKERRQKDFFAAMEANILNSISQGFKAPEKKNRLDLEFENKAISDDPLTITTPTTTTSSTGSSVKQLSPRKSRMERSSSSSRSRPNLVRTISSMDTSVLRELIKRVPSSRQVRGVPSGSLNPANRQPSNRSMGFGSSHHSRQGRLGGGSGRTLGSRTGSSSLAPVNIVNKQKKAGSAETKKGDGVDDDDDELPPLTVVTTPDLRKRESLGLDALAAQDPREMLIRRDSLTLDQLSFHGGGGGNLMDSRFFDQSAGSRLTMSSNSFHLDSNDSSGGGFLAHLGGSQSLLPQSGLFASNHSFNSLNSSDSHSLGQGLDTSHNGMSVCSNSLMPVEEGVDESEYSNPRLQMNRNEAFLEEEEKEDHDLLDEGSFVLGAENGDLHQETTANWLDTLPPDENARSQELVGYGTNAKPFSDAGFTSFFDESMANFDLSDKETQALQKLALISEQMFKVTENDESDETDESDEIDDDDDMPALNEASTEFPLFLESSEDEEISEEEPSSEENEGRHSPSFQTPITSSTMKTTGTSSTAASARSPISRQRPGLGAKTSCIPRAVRNKQIREASADGSSSTHGSSSGDGSLAVANLALASATLTIDNARSHFTESQPLAAGSVPRQQSRRHTGGDWSPTKEPNRNHNCGDGGALDLASSASSLNSSNSIAMANAARRLSMFRLKNLDRSRLRVTGDGKGNPSSPESVEKSDAKSIQRLHASGTNMAAEKGMRTRPNLVRRNTCGTLYVGTTMSAPDKDATIKAEMEEETVDRSQFRIFNDLESQQGTTRRNDLQRRPASLPIPSLEQITTFYRDVFQRAQMEYDCIIISLIYVERLIKTTNGELRPRACNWRSILFSCMVLASKVWDDLSMWNKDFSQTCPNGVKFPLKRINELEVAILSALSYKVKVPASEYAKYYFLLRSMLIKSGLVGDNVDTTTPLDVEGAKRLQQVSTQFQSGIGATKRQMRKAKSMRSKSLGEAEGARVGAIARRERAKNKKVSLEHVVKM